MDISTQRCVDYNHRTSVVSSSLNSYGAMTIENDFSDLTIDNSNTTKTVVVLGSAYGGIGATANLARNLPAGWRVIAIDRSTHFNRE